MRLGFKQDEIVDYNMKDFGVIVVCCKSDYWSAKACCASIRHFMGDAPICLLIDGGFNVDGLKKQYGVQVINYDNVSNPMLKQRSFGYGITKMIAFWESPFEYFLLLDADIIVWGDMRKHADFQHYDLIIDRPAYGYSEADVNKWFFDTKKLEQHFPHFDWRDRPYVCTGVTLAKRGLFDLSEYAKLLDMKLENPDIFHYGEMGFLNLMMFAGADAGKFRLGQEDIQIIVQDYDQQALKKRFSIGHGLPVAQNGEAKAIHYAGMKALMSNAKHYTELMSFFRRQYLKDRWRLHGYLAELVLRAEEYFLSHPRAAKLLGHGQR